MRQSKVDVVVGIDVSKRRLDVHVLPSGETFSATPDEAGLADLVSRLRDSGATAIGLEASGGYERPAVKALTAAGLTVRRLDPTRVRRFARALGRKAKNDRIDAAVIAAFVEAVDTPAVTPDADRERLSQLVAYRRQLTDELVTLGNRHEKGMDPGLVAMGAERRALLLRQRDEVERRIADLIAQTPDLDRLFSLLTSVPGVGPVLASTVIANMPEIGTIGRHPLAALVGIAPFDRDSGQTNRPRHILGGRRNVRNVLYMATVAAIRYNPVIAAFHKRLIQNGKPQKVAITACMRKLIIILNAIVRDKVEWQYAD